MTELAASPPPATPTGLETKGTTMNGAELIAAERTRQIEQEGWTPEHDDDHDSDELALAAASYAIPSAMRSAVRETLPELWPWEARFWKPTPNDRVRELVKAGALIAAEIDRLL